MTEGKQVQDFIKSQKKTARQLFEETGWEYKFQREWNVIEYYKEAKNDALIVITFDLADKSFNCLVDDWVSYDYLKIGIDMETLKLIIAQCKELGWL